MGYTHYWHQRRSFTDTEWKAITKETKRIIAAAETQGIPIRGWDGKGKPKITVKEISFNGNGPDDDHETLLLMKEQRRYAGEDLTFSFCKTARKPYDAVVVSVLFAAANLAPGALELSSDGDGEEDQPVFRQMFPTDDSPSSASIKSLREFYRND